MEQQQRRFEIEDKEKIKAADARIDANAWLEHVGWAIHLEGFDPEAMLQLTDPFNAGDKLSPYYSHAGAGWQPGII
ncbi:hypothetical protein FOZG_18236 [Fusarium oxysporum Fo47]|uniref:Uncharacterized protein n=1 Tax=Fusarium oxysporum Fo47 TaxID=660027 RepID=W9J869_FUSOX|nr:hypothetical protein FOZG_18236 [Fusarium oxysporum Fo47]